MKERFLFLITILLILCSFSVLALDEITNPELELETTEYEIIIQEEEKTINPEIEPTKIIINELINEFKLEGGTQ